MLPVEHKATHLYRKDAYQEYCWSVDAYGAYQPASFIYLCFESFGDLCSQYGMQLVNAYEPLQTAYGLIIRLEDLKDAEQVKSALAQGKNAIALFPSEMIGLYYGGDKARIAKAVEVANLVGVEQAEQKISGTLSNRERVGWEEITTNAKGRLFVTRDVWLSDGYFMDGYGKSDENSQTLANLVREFATFKYGLIRVSFKNQVSIWPAHEPISFVIELVNHGPHIDTALVNLELSDGFEPISPLERELSNLRTLSRTSFAFQVVPRVDGQFNQPFTATITAGNREKVFAHTVDWSLEIAPSYGGALRSHTKQDDVTLSRLLTVFRDTDLFSEVKTLPELVKVDTKACLNRMRTVAEKLVYLVLDKKGIRLSQRTLANAIQMAQTSKILSARSIGYLHTVRVIGNLASHPSSEPLTDTDVRIVSYSLACIMEEIMDKHLI